MANYYDSLRYLLKGLPTPTNLGTSNSIPINGFGPQLQIPRGPALPNIAPNGIPPAFTQAPVMGGEYSMSGGVPANHALVPVATPEISRSGGVQPRGPIYGGYDAPRLPAPPASPSIIPDIDRVAQMRAADSAAYRATMGQPASAAPSIPGGAVSNSGKSIAGMLSKAAPYATGALIAADVANRVLSKDSTGYLRSDTLANLDTRGLSPADAFLFAPDAITGSTDSNTKALSAEAAASYSPFKFNNPIPGYVAAYNEAGVPGVLGRMARTGVNNLTTTVNQLNPKPLIEGAGAGYTGDYAVKLPVASTRPVETLTQPQAGLPIGGGITVTGANTSGRAGFSPRTYRDASGNVVASGVSSVVGRGGFVGAATDAEAARNLQARTEQDTAARGMAANFDRQTEALRNARAEKLGISREVLDASEGRGVIKGTPVETAPNPFAMPGDNFGDDIRRRNELLGTINDPSARKTDRAAALSTLQSFMSQPQPQPVRVQPQPQGNPLDANKFLLDQQKFAWQQGVDRNKAAIDELEAQSKVAGAKLQQQKYNDEQRQAFINDFSYPAEGAPQAQLGELAWNLSKSTGGQLSPQEATLYIQKVAEKNGVDWKDVQPESLVALGREAMKLAKQDRMQK